MADQTSPETETEPVAWRIRVREGNSTFHIYTERLPYDPGTDRTVVFGEPQPVYLALAQCSKQQIKDAFNAGYWAWFGPATNQELERGIAELDKSWSEYEATLSQSSTDRNGK